MSQIDLFRRADGMPAGGDSVSAQLAKENKRFVFSEVTPGARMRDLAVPLWWLFNAGLLFKVKRVSRPEKPLSAYEDGAFKLFFLDIGLLGAKAGLDIRAILEGDRVFREFKGALAEQFVHQEMRGLVDAQYYWTQRDAALDFLIDDGADILPIEVKAERNLQAKSLRLFCERFKMETAVRFSMHGYTKGAYPFGTRLIDCPLFAARSLLASRSCV